MTDGQLIARKTSDNPPIYRVTFDDSTGPVEVGSVSERTSHVKRTGEVFWHWGVDILPLSAMPTPTGDAWSRDAAMQDFKAAFTKWLAQLHPGDWQRKRDYIKASLVGRR